MDNSIVMVGFVGAVALFGVWLVLMLRAERSLIETHARQRLHHRDSHRQATRSARREPMAPVTEIPVVRPGAFCRVVGNVGRTNRGTILVCSSRPNGRPRWAKARSHAHMS